MSVVMVGFFVMVGFRILLNQLKSFLPQVDALC